MGVKQFFLPIFFLTVTVVRGQVTTDKFEKFATKQDSLFGVAYQHKDIKAFNKLLTEFLSKYDKLSADDKKSNSRYLSGAYYNFSCTYSLLNNKPMALTYLKKSIAAGYVNYNHIQEDTDLDNIRKERSFQVINNQLRNIGDYLGLAHKLIAEDKKNFSLICLSR